MARFEDVKPRYFEICLALPSMLLRERRTSFGEPVDPEVESSKAKSECISGPEIAKRAIVPSRKIEET
jgi:hypothetical protein